MQPHSDVLPQFKFFYLPAFRLDENKLNLTSTRIKKKTRKRSKTFPFRKEGAKKIDERQIKPEHLKILLLESRTQITGQR